MTTSRRLAAILAADVAGYSRLIGADEEGTLNRLRSNRTDVIHPKISEHRGRIVKTTGDGLLVEFTSVVDALRCATQWQHAMRKRGAGITRSGMRRSDATGRVQIIGPRLKITALVGSTHHTNPPSAVSMMLDLVIRVDCTEDVGRSLCDHSVVSRIGRRQQGV